MQEVWTVTKNFTEPNGTPSFIGIGIETGTNENDFDRPII